MLVIFKSKAAAEVIMYEEHAKRILDLLHKDIKRGVITAAETVDAISTLEQEIARSKTQSEEENQREEVTGRGPEDDDRQRERREFVSFATRAYPLLEMLRAANRKGNDVLWGV
ncbi:MAG TPA: DUF1840 domain-containing protein [Burkholderiaceae bacterium]|jgi:hypothetical protein|nr:DUF1840 domain-containing protein [Burkholderiaceae bacterium]